MDKWTKPSKKEKPGLQLVFERTSLFGLLRRELNKVDRLSQITSQLAFVDNKEQKDI